MTRTIGYKDEEGNQYKISYSEELQLKHLKALNHQTRWLKKNFYIKLALTIILGILTFTIVYTLYKLDLINFFTGVLYR
ncbi:MAG TPA: hypothetical protein VJB89_01885 [Candidatus Nanoarchaeia archaeon]|nr:hypothetical protein [Candidatus Nanoarchaeia archaeon]